MFVVDDLLKIPLTIGKEILTEMARQIDEELLTTEAAVRKKIMSAQLRFETGEISEEDYTQTMAFLRERLEKVGGR